MADAYFTRRVRFSAMHALGNPQLSDAENKKIFDKCFRTHGHDYHLEVTVKGMIDEKSGLSCDRDHVDDILEKSIVRKYSGQHLNDHFKDTSGESLALEFYRILGAQLRDLVQVRVQETRKNFFTYGNPAIPVSDFRFLMY